MMLKTVASTVIALTAMAGAASAQQRIVRTDGSSTVFPVTEAMAEEFQKSSKGVKVVVGNSGTGGGFKKFCRGETDISNASRPIRAVEAADCKKSGIEFIELPIALDALAVTVNPKNTWVNDLTVAELRTIWQPQAQGKVMNWSQVRQGFPDRPLRLYGPGVDSGTYDYFTAAIVGKEHSSRGDYTASEDDNVLVQGIAGDVNALGFFGLAYYHENQKRLKGVGIRLDAKAKPVLPTFDNALSGVYQPLTRPIFIYVSIKALTAKPYVASFVEFYLTKANAAKLIKEVGYVPLPDHGYDTFMQRFKERRTGTAFVGSQVGLSIANLLKAPLSN
ncbi:MAG: PstS family phosphate ABC transporter substrate-binding protein [Hyphomicrobiales bacterium]|nr:PstS family phosphate ABC transporter substrate-binding protein [Hyphomicrobiales bacterium]